MSALLNALCQQIKHHGPMNLAEYMQLCLGHPQFGYYMSRDPFGIQGDFTTAPEITQVFGELIGVWLVDAWFKSGSPSCFSLVECGPGRGTLMSDLLRATKNIRDFHDAFDIHLLETSPVLKEKQKKSLSSYKSFWHDTLATIPSDRPLFVIANEFIDALPIRQFTKKGSDWYEKLITIDKNDTLCFCSGAPQNNLPSTLYDYENHVEDDDIVEISLQRESFLRNILNMIKNQNGICFFIDYGFEKFMPGDTLQAVEKHSFVSVFNNPGDTDITSHVDFEMIKRIAGEYQLKVHGPVSQGSFLNLLGVHERMDYLKKRATNKQSKELDMALNRLIENDQMGDLFKVIAISSYNVDFEGFS